MVAFTERAYGPKLVPVGAEGHALATLPRFLLKVLLQDQTYWPWLMRRAGVDVVHTPIFAGMVAAPRPYVLTLHDLIPLQTPEAVSRSAAAYWRLVLPRSVARADAIITGSEFTRREILDWFGLPPERVVTRMARRRPSFRAGRRRGDAWRASAPSPASSAISPLRRYREPAEEHRPARAGFGALSRRRARRRAPPARRAARGGRTRRSMRRSPRARSRPASVTSASSPTRTCPRSTGWRRASRISRAARASDCRRSKRSRAVRRSSAPTARAFPRWSATRHCSSIPTTARRSRGRLRPCSRADARWSRDGRAGSSVRRAFTWERAAAATLAVYRRVVA